MVAANWCGCGDRSTPTHLAAWPDGAPQTRLIVIAKGVDRAHVEASLAAFNRLAMAA